MKTFDGNKWESPVSKEYVDLGDSKQLPAFLDAGDVNLDTLTSPGIYKQTTAKDKSLNYPLDNTQGILVVFQGHSSVGLRTSQEYVTTNLTDPQRFWRTYYSGKWSSWKEYASTQLATSALDGLFSKSDKQKLDSSTFSDSSGTLVQRNSSGEISVSRVALTNQPSSDSSATRKDYVDSKIPFVNAGEYLIQGSTSIQQAAFRSAMSAAIAHPSKTLFVPAGDFYFSSSLVVPEGLTIRGTKNTNLYVTGNSRLFALKSNTWLDSLNVYGTLDPSIPADVGDQRAVTTETETENVSNIKVTNCRFENIKDMAVMITDCDGFVVDNNIFWNNGYAAFACHRARNGSVDKNRIHGTGLIPDFAINAYGISVNSSGKEDPGDTRPVNITISGNIIDNQAWEAIDSHLGDNMSVIGNVIRTSEAGVVITSKVGGTLTASWGVSVIGNTIDGAGYPAEFRRSGITINGDPDASRYSNVTIVGNTIMNMGIPVNHRNFPGQQITRGAALQLSYVDEVAIIGNTFKESRGSHISFRETLAATVSGNVFKDSYVDLGDGTRQSAVISFWEQVSDGIVNVTGNTIHPRQNPSSRYNNRIYQNLQGATARILDSGNDWGQTAFSIGNLNFIAHRPIGGMTSPPSVGYHRAGSIQYSSAPHTLGYIGWVCTLAGTPGTWVKFGKLETS